MRDGPASGLDIATAPRQRGVFVGGDRLNNSWIERCLKRNAALFDRAVVDCIGYSLEEVIVWLMALGFEPLLIPEARKLLKERGFE